MFSGKSLKLFSVAGIAIYVDWSWMFIFVLLVFNLVFGVLPVWHPDWSASSIWIVGIIATLLFFASVLAHELAHSLVAKAQGLPVRRIVLFLFGGVSNIEREPRSSKDEFLMAIVGPLTSIVLGIIFWQLFTPMVERTQGEGMAALSRLGPVGTLLAWLGPVNVLLGLFNLIPAFPLDGGRVLRAALWGITGNLRTATKSASYVGQAFGWLLIFAGIMMLFGIRIPLLGGGLIGGFWLAFIGWFINQAAATSRFQFIVHEVLEDVPVSHLMRSDVPAVTPGTTVSSLVNDWLIKSDERSFPVMEGSQLIGFVCLEDVRKVQRGLWDQTSVRDIMTPAEKLNVVSAADTAATAFERLAASDVRQLPVLEGNRMVGILRRRDIVRWLQLHSELPA